MSADLITDFADTAEANFDEGKVWTLRIEPDEIPEVTAVMIDAHGRVRDELRDRGRTIRTSIEVVREGEVVRDPDGIPLQPGTYLAIAADAD